MDKMAMGMDFLAKAARLGLINEVDPFGVVSDGNTALV